MFWKNFYSLCEDNNEKPLNVVTKLSIGHGSITKWKNGAVPNGKNLQKIADYFGVTVDYLLTGQKEKPTANSELSNDEMFTLYQSLPPELQKQAEDYLRFLAAKHKDSEDSG